MKPLISAFFLMLLVSSLSFGQNSKERGNQTFGPNSGLSDGPGCQGTPGFGPNNGPNCQGCLKNTAPGPYKNGQGKNRNRNQQDMQQLFAQLELNPEQIAKIEEHRKLQMEKFKSHKEDIRSLNKKFQETTRQYPPNEGELYALDLEMQKFHAQRSKEKIETLLFFSSVLNESQYRQFVEKFNNFHGKRGKGRQSPPQ